MTSFLKELRTEAMRTVDVQVRGQLVALADDLDDAIWTLYQDKTTANMIYLNGVWIRAHKVLELAVRLNMPPPTPLGGAMPVPQERKAA